jgi:hypothetical protein
MTAGEVKFSEAMSWMVVFWRSSSRSRMSKSSLSSKSLTCVAFVRCARRPSWDRRQAPPLRYGCAG